MVIDDSPGVLLRKHLKSKHELTRVVKSVMASFGSHPGLRFAVETASGRGLPLTSAGEPFERELDRFLWTPVYRSGNRVDALKRACRVLRGAIEDRKLVVLVTDFSMNAEETDGGLEVGETKTRDLVEKWAGALTPFSNQTSSPQTPTLLMLDIGSKPLRQWSIESLGVSSPVGADAGRMPLAGQPFHLNLRVRCHWGGGRRSLILRTANLRIQKGRRFKEGAARAMYSRSVVLSAGQEATYSVPILPAKPGAFWYQAQLEGVDEWPFDDGLDIVVEVREKPRVGVLDVRGKRGPDAFRTRKILQHLRSALNPMAGSGSATVQLRDLRIADLRENMRLDVLVVLHPPSGPGLPIARAQRLSAAVEKGLHLLWVPDLSGPANELPREVNSTWKSRSPLVPRMVERVELKEDVQAGPAKNAHQGGGWRLGLSQPDHTLMKRFAGRRNGDLPGVRFGRRLRMVTENRTHVPREVMSSREGMSLARFGDGAPAIVCKQMGRGMVCQLGFGLEDSGGIAGTPAWPIFLSEFIAVATMKGLGLRVDTVYAGKLRRTWKVRSYAEERTYELSGPHLKGGATRNLESKGMRSLGRMGEPSDSAGFGTWRMVVPKQAEYVQMPDLDEPGVYRLTESGHAYLNPGPHWISCRIHPLESSNPDMPVKLKHLLKEAVRGSGGAALESVDQLKPALATLRPGRQVASWFWILFALAMFLELSILCFRRKSA